MRIWKFSKLHKQFRPPKIQHVALIIECEPTQALLGCLDVIMFDVSKNVVAKDWSS